MLSYAFDKSSSAPSVPFSQSLSHAVMAWSTLTFWQFAHWFDGGGGVDKDKALSHILMRIEPTLIGRVSSSPLGRPATLQEKSNPIYAQEVCQRMKYKVCWYPPIDNIVPISHLEKYASTLATLGVTNHPVLGILWIV